MKAYFGDFGGRFVPELLAPPLTELEEAMRRWLPDPGFREELDGLLRDYAGRPSPLTFCPRLSEDLGINLWLKREDLLHGGSHKINNTLGQGLLARRIGKTTLAAETGAGQHGVATAMAAARLGMESLIFMGEADVERQSSNVLRMRLMGSGVVSVKDGTRTLKDAINEALRHWIATQKTTHYCFGTAAGPHPFPSLVAEFQSVIGGEIREEFLKKSGKLPDAVVACVGGGSNAIGAFRAFLADKDVALVGVEAAGTGEPGCHNSAPLNLGSPGILHGQFSMLLQDKEGQVLPSHSVSAGLDYPGVGPEHSHLRAVGRVRYDLANDDEAIEAFRLLSLREGIIPALESSHALAWVAKNARNLKKGANVVVNLSGRGDKDLGIYGNHRGRSGEGTG
ncbi:MAG: tryptophan synthase subunit beta [Deltaproteobacteria bacterium]|jgi:tryptophan synthase beta chain|nr:tryptophan synthase subunit beta [Deltaproteobacteria bacterium]